MTIRLALQHHGAVVRSLVSSNRTRRCVHIPVSLVAVLLLLKPFDCFSGRKLTKEAADCCKRGKCRPSTKDDCCKGTLPGGKELVVSAKVDQNHSPIALPVIARVLIVEPMLVAATPQEASSPPGSPPSTRLNLPRLI